MMEEEKKKLEVKYITSLIMAAPDIDGQVRHLQFSVVQEVDTKKFRCFFDVVDPSHVKLKEDA